MRSGSDQAACAYNRRIGEKRRWNSREGALRSHRYQARSVSHRPQRDASRPATFSSGLNCSATNCEAPPFASASVGGRRATAEAGHDASVLADCVFAMWLAHGRAPRCANWRGQNVAGEGRRQRSHDDSGAESERPTSLAERRSRRVSKVWPSASPNEIYPRRAGYLGHAAVGRLGTANSSHGSPACGTEISFTILTSFGSPDRAAMPKPAFRANASIVSFDRKTSPTSVGIPKSLTRHCRLRTSTLPSPLPRQVSATEIANSQAWSDRTA
jgi:hypothetical protein